MEKEVEKLISIQIGSGLNKKLFAESLNISQADFSRYISLKEGVYREMPIKLFCKLREIYNIDLNWLLCNDTDNIDMVYITLCEIITGDMQKIQGQSYIEKRKIQIPKSIIHSNRIEQLRAIIYPNDWKMKDKTIRQGDIVIFEPLPESASDEQNGVFLISYNDKLIARQIKYQYHGCYTIENGSSEENENIGKSMIKGKVIVSMHIFY
jgi:hypothetical protein